MYNTEAEIDLALNLGYKIEMSQEIGSRFTRSRRVVWRVRDGWQTANLIIDTYENHVQFAELPDALRRPL